MDRPSRDLPDLPDLPDPALSGAASTSLRAASSTSTVGQHVDAAGASDATQEQSHERGDEPEPVPEPEPIAAEAKISAALDPRAISNFLAAMLVALSVVVIFA